MCRLPASGPQVRYARSHQYIQAGAGPDDNRQLFFACAPTSATEEQLKELFGRYGEVEDVNLFRERRTHASKGCGFITMHTREQAIATMAALDEKHLMEGATTPLAVRWADPLLQIKKRRAVEDSNAENRMLFFAKVLRSANEDEVRSLFNKFGRVIEVNLFRAFQGAPTTKGCGLVTMGSNDEAAAAIEALDNRHVWDGMEAPMVVKWMDAALQKRRREEHLAAMRQGLVPSMGSDLWMGNPLGMAAGSRGGAGASLSQGKLLDAAAAAAGLGEASSSNTGLHTELLPAGCAPDAYKLFVGNVPKTFTEEDLRPVFEAVGPVVELVVVRDKFSHESKGSAFVWYTNKADADQAVLKFNLQRVLSDPTGEQDRPLVVRRANMRKPAASLMLGGASGLAAAAAGLSANSTFSSGSNVGSGYMSVGPNSAQLAARDISKQQQQQQGGLGQMPGLGPDVTFHLQPYMAMQHQQPQQQYAQAMPAVVYQTCPQQQQQQPVVSTSDNSGSGSYLLNPFGGPAQGGMSSPIQQHVQQQGYVLSPQVLQPMLVQQQPAQGAAGLASMQQQQHAAQVQQQLGPHPGMGGMGGAIVHLSLQVTGNQFATVSNSLYSVSAMSGANLASAPVAAGLFQINITGAQAQVNRARQLLTSLLTQVL